MWSNGRGRVTLPSQYIQGENLALAYATTIHKGQGVTVHRGILVVDRATSAEHLYVGMTRGRHHNQACVIVEAAGDEHQTQEAPTVAEVLRGALKRRGSQNSATETLRDELMERLAGALQSSEGHSIAEVARHQAAWQPARRTPIPRREAGKLNGRA